jgi:hypothetical protein
MYLGPLNPLWPFGTPIPTLGGGYVAAGRVIPWGWSRSAASLTLLALAAAIGIAWYLRLRRRGVTCSPICLLALLGALPCICDTVNQRYYWLSLLMPLAAWESLESRVPAAVVFVSLLVWAASGAMGHIASNFIYAGTMVAEAILIIYIARHGTRPTPTIEPATAASPAALVTTTT